MEESLRDVGGLDDDLAIRSTYESPVVDIEGGPPGHHWHRPLLRPERAPTQVLRDVVRDSRHTTT
jgi:hypothetical protein